MIKYFKDVHDAVYADVFDGRRDQYISEGLTPIM